MTMKYDPFISVPLPGGLRLNPLGLFDTTPNNIIIPSGDDNGGGELSPAAQETINRLRFGGKIQGRPPIIGTDTPVSSEQILQQELDALPPAEASALVRRIAEAFGLSEEEVADLIAEVGISGAIDLLNEASGGGGGSGRFLFPEEQEALRLANERDRRILAGELGWTEVRPGFFFDPITGQSYDENDLEVARERLTEDARQFDTSFEEEVRQFGLKFNENQRQFDVSVAEDRRQFDERLDLDRERLGLDRNRLSLEAELGRRSATVNEADFIRQVLSNPADFLFRAALTRGQTSGVPRLTQADIINQFNRDIAASGSNFVQTPTYNAPTNAPQPQEVDFTGQINTLVNQTLQNDPAYQRLQATLAQPNVAPRLRASLEESANKYANDIRERVSGFFPSQTVTQVTPQVDTARIQPPPQMTSVSNPARMVTQQELADLSRQTAPPAVRDVIEGRDPGIVRLPIPAPTPRSLSNLTGSEASALNTALGAEFGIGLEEVAKATEQRFTAPQSRRSARLVI